MEAPSIFEYKLEAPDITVVSFVSQFPRLVFAVSRSGHKERSGHPGNQPDVGASDFM